MTLEHTAYVVAGIVLSAFYVPQIIVLLRDRTHCRAYSLSKGVAQLLARAAMMPLVFAAVDSTTILVMQSIDVALRATEVGVAIWSIRSQSVAEAGASDESAPARGEQPAFLS